MNKLIKSMISAMNMCKIFRDGLLQELEYMPV